MSVEEGQSASRDLFGFLLFLAFIGVVWFATGGPNRPSAQGFFLKPPPPLGTGSTYGLSFLDNVVTQGGGAGGATYQTSVYPGTTPQFQAELAALTSPGNASPFKGQVGFASSVQGADLTDPNTQYVVIGAAGGNSAPINITGWSIKSAVSQQSATIGSGVSLFYSGRENIDGPVLLYPGTRATISTGHSPVGDSFRVNACSGYLQQFQTYAPPLQSACPSATYEASTPSSAVALDTTCINYLQTLPQCRAPITTSLPPGLSSACNSFVGEALNYNGCVDRHRFDSNFYTGGGWRLYLNYPRTLWAHQRETLELLDQSGKVVDLYSYNY